MTTVFLVDDQTLFQVGLKQVLKELKDVGVVGEAPDLTSAFPQPEHKPSEVALLAIGLVDGTASIREAAVRTINGSSKPVLVAPLLPLANNHLAHPWQQPASGSAKRDNRGARTE